MRAPRFVLLMVLPGGEFREALGSRESI